MLERSFWSRSDRFDFWGMEALCGTAVGSKLSLLLDRAGYDVAAFYRLPAAGRLIVLHRFLTAAADSSLAEVGGSTRVSFESFALNPHDTVERACAEVGALVPAPAGSVRLEPAAPGYRPTDRRWAAIMQGVERACPGEAS